MNISNRTKSGNEKKAISVSIFIYRASPVATSLKRVPKKCERN